MEEGDESILPTEFKRRTTRPIARPTGSELVRACFSDDNNSKTFINGIKKQEFKNLFLENRQHS